MHDDARRKWREECNVLYLFMDGMLHDWLPKIRPDAHIEDDERERALDELWEKIDLCRQAIEAIAHIHGFDMACCDQLMEEAVQVKIGIAEA
jgi:hypothetical protein